MRDAFGQPAQSAQGSEGTPSRDDALASHRVPPQLLGMIPTNAGGFGDVGKARSVFKENEIDPLIVRMIGLNYSLGGLVFDFKPGS